MNIPQENVRKNKLQYCARGENLQKCTFYLGTKRQVIFFNVLGLFGCK
jgi:hypothetical protein